MNVDRADPADLDMLRSVFSAASCGPPLGWGAVRAFEDEHRVVLPEPYRTFVAEICDGADGPPDYGLVPLAGVPSDWSGDPGGRVLAEPFPLTEALEWEEVENDPRPAEDVDAFLYAILNHGSVVLGTDGCGMNWFLAVSGPQRGHVWHISEEGADPFGAEFGLTTGDSGFAGWVRHWADGRPWFDAVRARA